MPQCVVLPTNSWILHYLAPVSLSPSKDRKPLNSIPSSSVPGSSAFGNFVLQYYPRADFFSRYCVTVVSQRARYDDGRRHLSAVSFLLQEAHEQRKSTITRCPQKRHDSNQIRQKLSQGCNSDQPMVYFGAQSQ